MTTSSREDLDKLMAALAQQRDELKLQMHLAKADAKDEWTSLESKWEEVQGKLGQVQNVAGQTLDEVGVAAGLMAEEIKRGYDRISKLF